MKPIPRRTFLSQAAALAGGFALARGARAADASMPNVILCMSDDQGWGDTAYNGHPVLRTPHLDQMAAEGLRFDRFYSGAPVCSPTRGSCLTGRHPYRYGIPTANAGHMKPEEITLAEALKPLGYTTGHFGKWHLGTMTKTVKESNRGGPAKTEHYSPPWDNGFDQCFSTEAKVPTYWKDDAYENYGTHYWTGPDQKVPAAEISGDDSKLIMDRALPFIRQAAENKTPFFSVIWFHAPHQPVVSASPYTAGYNDHKDYYGCITAMDTQMGRLREELRALGIAGNTMLWFCADNGPETLDDNAPGSTNGLRGRKRSLYEGGVRVPGLLLWPAMLREARTTSMPCSTSDYFPTVLDALDQPLPPRRPYDGVSLLPLLEGKMTERPVPIGFESGKQISLTDNRFKIYSSDAGNTYELYDIVADPGESNNIAASHPEVVATMKAAVDAWRRSCSRSAEGQDYGEPN
jgi:arylsulfatase A-like enzyme